MEQDLFRLPGDKGNQLHLANSRLIGPLGVSQFADQVRLQTDYVNPLNGEMGTLRLYYDDQSRLVTIHKSLKQQAGMYNIRADFVYEPHLVYVTQQNFLNRGERYEITQNIININNTPAGATLVVFNNNLGGRDDSVSVSQSVLYPGSNQVSPVPTLKAKVGFVMSCTNSVPVLAEIHNIYKLDGTMHFGLEGPAGQLLSYSLDHDTLMLRLEQSLQAPRLGLS